MRIYTKKGDKGETMTYGGKRVLKCDFNIETVGEVDELNAVLGMVKIKEIEEIQEDLLAIGAIVSGSKKLNAKYQNLENRIDFFEKEIDRMWGGMPEIKNFIIFRGNETASLLFFARAVCRRAERSLARLLCRQGRHRPGDSCILRYMNRLSDYLFCLGRWKNYKARVKERVWKSD